MGHTATEAEVKAVVDRVHEIGLKTELSRGEERTLVGVIGANAYAYREAFSHLSGIHEIIPITKPFKLASREFRAADTVVDVGGVRVGGAHEVVVMAGPCSVEGEEMLIETARHVAARGPHVRGLRARRGRGHAAAARKLARPGDVLELAVAVAGTAGAQRGPGLGVGSAVRMLRQLGLPGV